LTHKADRRRCVQCDGPMPERSPTGRPAVFCGGGCRKLHGYQCRALGRELERLLKLESIAALCPYRLPSDEANAERLVQRQIELEQRLRRLLGLSDGETVAD
jgi:hypothetical protein